MLVLDGMTWADACAAVQVHSCASLHDWNDDGGLVARVRSFEEDCVIKNRWFA